MAGYVASVCGFANIFYVFVSISASYSIAWCYWLLGESALVALATVRDFEQPLRFAHFGESDGLAPSRAGRESRIRGRYETSQIIIKKAGVFGFSPQEDDRLSARRIAVTAVAGLAD
jgi:hypothetical protein